MTREHKLALIIGFTLVLVVGVLISDHFSKAHEARVKSELPEVPARNLAADGLRPVGGNNGPGVGGGGGSGMGGSIFGPASALARNNGNIGASPDATLPPIHDPTLLTEAGTSTTEGGIIMGDRYSTPPADSNQIAVLVPRGFEPVTIRPDATLMHQDTRPIPSPSPRGPGMGVPSNAGDPNSPGGVRIVRPEGPTITPAPGSGRDSLPVMPEIKPARPAVEETINEVPVRLCTRHDVREGESLYGIAKSKYGDGALWEKLREFNKGKVAANGAMREGVTLLLPPKEALLGKPVPATNTPPGAPSVPARDQAAPGKPTPQKKNETGPADTAIAKAPSPRTYTVQKGDVLSEVARKTLGSSRRWTEIQALNTDVLDDEDSLVVGMVLKLPTR